MAAPDAALIEAIIGDVACHGNLARALRKHKVNPEGFHRWLSKDLVTRESFRAAKTIGFELQADNVLREANKKPPKGPDGKVDVGWVSWQRNKVDTLKWMLCHIVPRIYGQRTVIAGDADNPLAIADVTDAKSALLRGLTPKPVDAGTGGES